MQRSMPLAIVALELALTGCATRTSVATYPGVQVAPTVKPATWSAVATETGFVRVSAPVGPSLPTAPQGPHYVLGSPYQFDGVWYRPEADYDYSATGTASIYDGGAEGQRTADGETYQASVPTAAHKTLPLPSMARVTNLDNGRSVVVRVNDRGPFDDKQLIQLSKSAGAAIGINPGDSVRVRVEIMPAESRALAIGLGASGKEQPEVLPAVPAPKLTVEPISAELPALRPETSTVSAQAQASRVVIGPQYASADGTLPPTTLDQPEGAHYVLGAAYQFDGVWYKPAVDYHYDSSGTASIYDPGMKGPTTDGETYDPKALTAAHKTLPLPSIVQVTNLDNGRSIEVRVNDRGPFDDRQLIQLSPGAGTALGIDPGDSIRVRVQVKAEQSEDLAAWLARPDAAPHRATALPPGTDTASLDQPAQKPAVGTQFASLEGGYVLDGGHGHEGDETATGAADQALAAAGGDYSPALDTTRLAATGRPLLLFTLSGGDDQASSSDVPPPVMPTAVGLTPPVPPMLSPGSEAQATQIYIQAGAFRELDNAERMRDSLASLGAVSLVAEPWGNGVVNCVRVGPIPSMSDAQQLMDRIAAKGYRDSWLLVE